MDARASYLHTLGELRLDGARAGLGSPRKALALLAYLGRRTARRARREELMALFWGDRPEARARQSLRQVLLELRHAGTAIEVSGDVVSLTASSLTIDADDFERDVAAGRFEQAAARWQGDFLAHEDHAGGEQYRVWLEAEREALRRKLTYALERLVAAAETRAAWSEATRWSEVWTAALPYDERAHSRLINALALSGRKEDAFAHHAAFLVKLRRDLDLEPSAEVLDIPARLHARDAAALAPQNVPASWTEVRAPDITGALDAAWREVQGGGFRAVLLRAAAAETLTHLLDPFLRNLPEASSLLLEARANAARPWGTACELFAALRHAPGLSGAADDTLAELAVLVPEIRQRFMRLPCASGDAERQRAAISHVLADVADEARIIIRIDEIGAADAETRALIAGITTERPAGVLVVLTGAAATFDEAPLVHALNRSTICLDVQPIRDAGLPEPVARRNVPPRKRYRVAALLIIPLAVATAFATLRDERDNAVSANRLAVLPFTLHGAASYDYLREGMAELLSTNLDGVTAWRTVDAGSVLRQTANRKDALDPRSARSLADKLGADFFIMGSIAESAHTLRVQATLYRRSDQRLLVRATTEGPADRLFQLVDEIAGQLLTHVAAGARRSAHIAAVTTDSLSALKAYLDGEASLRRLDVREAFDAFHSAVTIDSTFALAWYGQATAASWLLAPDLALASADNALRHAHRLSARDRSLVESLRAFVAGDGNEAERLARYVLANYPDDIDRRMQLAEVLFHFGWQRGRSSVHAERELRRVLQVEPGHRPALVHLAQLSMRRGRRAEADSLMQRLIALETGEPTAEWIGALHAALMSDREALKRRMIGLYDAGDWWLTLATWDLAMYSSDLTAADRAALLLADAGRTSSARAIGHLARAHIELARGRWQNARAELTQLATFEPAWSIEYTALLSAAWFLPNAIDRHQALARQVERSPGSVAPRSRAAELPPWSTIHRQVHAPIKVYLQGLLQLRSGDFKGTAAQANLLSEHAESGAQGALVRGMSGSLRAQLLRLQGKPHDALRVLDETMVEAPFEYALASSFYSQALERFLRAELLSEVGRHDEALALLGTFNETSVLDAVYRAPAELKAGEIAEKQNDSAAAIRHYRRFIELWHDCDPELRPMVVEAQRRIERLRPRTH